MSRDYVVTSNGVNLFVDDLAHTYTWNGDGTCATDSVVQDGVTYVKTFVYTDGKITTNPRWTPSA